MSLPTGRLRRKTVSKKLNRHIATAALRSSTWETSMQMAEKMPKFKRRPMAMKTQRHLCSSPFTEDFPNKPDNEKKKMC